jgi:hypothetical protein
MNDILSGFSHSNEEMLKLIIYIIAILFIVSIVRSVFRLVMPIFIIGLVMVVFLGFTPGDVIDKGKQFATAGTNFFLESILPYLDSDSSSLMDKDAKENEDQELLPENKSPIEEDFNRFFYRDKENKDTETFGESENDDSLNKL